MSTPDRPAAGAAWHADEALVARYATGTLDEQRAWSLEAHMTSCAACRGHVNSTTSGDAATARMDAIWEGVRATVDAPRTGLLERGLLALRVPDHLARLLAATPSLRASWLAAVAAVFTVAVGAAWVAETPPLLFLVLAPLVPLAGAAAAFGPGMDPTYEVALAAPFRSGRLLLVRAVAVTAASFAMAGLAGLALPITDWRAAAWILPALATTATMLALATWLTPLRAATLVASAWIGVVVLAERLAEVPLAAFRAPGQGVALALTAAAAAVLLVRRSTLDLGRHL